MSDELVFYTNPMSRSRVVRWMLEEVGAPYRTELLDYAGAMKTPAYLTINPMGKVPAITHRGQTITESAAICAYLADAFPEAKLAPPLAERAAYYRWLFFAAGPFEAALTNRSLGVEVPPAKRAMVGYCDVSRVLDALEGALDGHPYIAGDTFTAADVYVGAGLAMQMAFGMIERRSAFGTYVARLHDRPAYHRATEIDGALPVPTPVGA